MRAVDLFCCAGGASRGLDLAGFKVRGVDREPQGEYPYPFTLGDALDESLEDADLVWASPPCQKHTAYKRRPNHVAEADCFIARVREKLRRWGGLYIIENVAGAPLENPIMLCGSMFGLDVQRHRMFETNFFVPTPECRHDIWTPRYPGATNRAPFSRKTVEVGVYRIPLATQQKAMGIDWMSLGKLSQAIPPDYAYWLGRFARDRLESSERSARVALA